MEILILIAIVLAVIGVACWAGRDGETKGKAPENHYGGYWDL